ncbi:MAG: efflux RND transporter permease subunit, partial [Bacteroidota bacterium]
PEAVSYPEISLGSVEEDRKGPILSYTIVGDQSPYDIQQYGENVIAPELAQIEGVKNIKIYGANPFAWELAYDPDQLRSLGFNREDLASGIENNFLEESLDEDYSFKAKGSRLRQGFPGLTFSLQDSLSQRVLSSKELLQIQRKERPPNAYFRINGQNAINMLVYGENASNEIRTARLVKEKIASLGVSLPDSFSLLETYDASAYLKEELVKIGWRSLASLLILLVFVWAISRSWKYLCIIFLSLAANLGIARLGYYLLGLELHLYSLAAITVSFGLIIDNSIVMTDHLRYKGNRNVFLALLAATLTSIGALSVIFFLEESQQLKLLDFAWVMLINLSVSLAVALWLIPALVDGFSFGKYSLARKNRSFRSLRRVQKLNTLYRRFLGVNFRLKPILICLLILGFGLPVFLLPERIGPQPGSYQAINYEADSSSFSFQLGEFYNETFGSSNYRREVKPWVDKILGGSLRLFLEETYPNSFNSEPERTVLHVSSQMPYGSTLEQMNETFLRMESYLLQFEEIDQFQSNIYSSQQARIKIYFKPEFDRSSFPYFLKSRLESRAVDLGGADWSIYGVGRGFSNAVGMGAKNSRIVLKGYNYPQLRGEGEKLKTKLLKHPRIKEVFLNGRMRWDYRPNYEYVMDFQEENLASVGVRKSQLLQFLKSQSKEERSLRYSFINDKYESIILKAKEEANWDLWKNLNSSIPLSNSLNVKLKELASIEKRPVGDVIDKEDQQYKLLVEYDFIGPYRLQNKVQNNMIAESNQELPLGYKAEKQSYAYWGQEDPDRQYLLVFLVMGIIFCICGILLESLIQSLIVVLMVPVSFIGVFLTFYLFELNFDQGGYAGLLLLSGITVNSALFILNDYNNLKKSARQSTSLDTFLKAFQSKIIPIALTIISTLLGLSPFLLGGADEPFWFGLAAGTIGGLLFSIVGILGFLPMFL